MTIRLTRRFERDFAGLPDHVRTRAEKQLGLLLTDPRHPSLRLKKMAGCPEVWEGRVTRSYRFTFQLVGDAYVLRRIGPHDILVNP
jgi:hypothetical protein